MCSNFSQEIEPQQILVDCKTANQMWVNLTAQHLEQANDNLYDLQARFYQYQHKEPFSVKTHIAEIKAIAHHLSEVGKAVQDAELVTKIVCTLPDDFRNFKSNWRQTPVDRQTLASLTSFLLMEEREMAKLKPKVTTNQDTAFHSSSSKTTGHHHDEHQQNRGKQEEEHKGMSAQQSKSHWPNQGGKWNSKKGGRVYSNREHQNTQNENKNGNYGGKTSRFCNYCTMNNHNTEDCHTKRRHDKADQEKAELAAKRMRMDQGKLAVNREQKVPIEDQDFSLVSTTPRYDTRSTADWFADSGATQHMSDQREAMMNFISIPEGSWCVNGIGSSKYEVKGKGDVPIWTMINGNRNPGMIKNVLYVPELGTNLFSIAAVIDLGVKATFSGTCVNFFTQNGDLVMMGERVGRTLYLLAIQPRPQLEGVLGTALVSSISPTLNTWHRRLAHVSYKNIIKMASSGVVDGLDLGTTTIPLEPCAGCSHGKHRRSSFPAGRTRATYCGEMIHSDLCGPMEQPTPGGALYYALFIDDYSGWRFIFFLKMKSEASNRFMELIHTIRGQTGYLVRVLRTDGGGEWSSKDFAIWLNTKGIRHESSAPHTPEQDGVSERGIRTITEGARSCLYDQHPLSEPWGEEVTGGTLNLIKECRLPKYLWAEAAAFTVYSLNRVLCKASPLTPYETWHHRKPNLTHLRVFGSIAYVHIPKIERKKWDQKSLRCIFVGYSETQKAYRFWEPVSKSIKISINATFDEHHRLAAIPSDPPVSSHRMEYHQPTISSPEVPKKQVSFSLIPEEHTLPDDHQQEAGEMGERQHIPIDDPPPSVTIPTTPDEVHHDQSVRRSARGRIPLKQWPDLAKSARLDDVTVFEPSSYIEAVTSTDADFWKMAINEEYQALMTNETWSVVPCPPDRVPIKCKWIFKFKPAANGQASRYRARLVACGYSQRPGIDYDETYAAVVTHDTLRTLMSIVAAEDLEMFQMDVQSAFLHGVLKEEIYMVQPDGFAIPGREHEACRLRKSIYGLKQASFVWGERLTDFLTEQGFKQSDADPCLYIRKTNNEKTYIIFWVDDGIITSKNQQTIDALLAALNERFKIRSHPVSLFVGVTITRDRQKQKIFLSQPDYIKKIVRTFRMESCAPKATPADSNTHLMEPTKNDSNEKVPYREAIGSLLFLSIVTRPDISFAVGVVSRYCENHDQSHWKAVRRIISYLSGTAQHGICFNGSDKRSPLVGYCDDSVRVVY